MKLDELKELAGLLHSYGICKKDIYNFTGVGASAWDQNMDNRRAFMLIRENGLTNIPVKIHGLFLSLAVNIATECCEKSSEKADVSRFIISINGGMVRSYLVDAFDEFVEGVNVAWVTGHLTAADADHKVQVAGVIPGQTDKHNNTQIIRLVKVLTV